MMDSGDSSAAPRSMPPKKTASFQEGETKLKKSSSLRLGDVFKAPSMRRSNSGSSRTFATRWSSRSSSLSLESSFASLRVEDEGVDLKSCMKTKTLEESLSSNASFDFAMSDDSLVEKERTSTKEARTPQFSTIEIREYPIMLGDNPSALDGPPLTIDWEHEDTLTFSLDEYEETRGPRRGKTSLCIPPSMREERLLEAGCCSLSEIIKTRRELKRIQNERFIQMNSSSLHNKLNEGSELMNRKLKRWVLRRPSGRALYDDFREQQVAYCIEKQEQKNKATLPTE